MEVTLVIAEEKNGRTFRKKALEKRKMVREESITLDFLQKVLIYCLNSLGPEMELPTLRERINEHESR